MEEENLVEKIKTKVKDENINNVKIKGRVGAGIFLIY